MPDPNNVVLREHGLAWVGLCKNANSSIKLAFAESLGKKVEWGNEHQPGLFNYVPLRKVASSGLWRFAIVRNPYDRIESCWRNKCFHSYRPSFKAWGLEKGMAFKEFVEVIAKTPDDRSQGFGQHWRSQTYDLMIHGNIVVDYLGRFETLRESWDVVRSHSLMELPELPKVNTTKEPAAPWKEEIRRLVVARFRKDFEVLGYVA